SDCSASRSASQIICVRRASNRSMLHCSTPLASRVERWGSQVTHNRSTRIGTALQTRCVELLSPIESLDEDVDRAAAREADGEGVFVGDTVGDDVRGL